MKHIAKILMAAALAWPISVQAQDEPKYVLLARTCLREAGWEITDDCAAIHAVIVDRVDVTKVRYKRMIRAYSKPKASRAWVDTLTADAAMPADWPEEHPWSAYQSRWRALMAHARSVLANEVKPACRAHHWGDSGNDRKRALRYGWTQVPCGDALNEFWVTKRACADDGPTQYALR